MGGDHAPHTIVDGALAAVRHLDLGVVLAGPAARLESELARHPDVDRARVRIADAPDVVAMEESPAAALRRKPGASIKVAADIVARGEAAALVSAGHTGATVMAAHAAFGMLPGVDRPALAATIPTPQRRAVLLGVGGVTLVGHGRSSAKAVRNAVAVAYRFASTHFIARVQNDIAAAAIDHP